MILMRVAFGCGTSPEVVLRWGSGLFLAANEAQEGLDRESKRRDLAVITAARQIGFEEGQLQQYLDSLDDPIPDDVAAIQEELRRRIAAIRKREAEAGDLKSEI